MQNQLPELTDIQQAAKRIQPVARQTPVFESGFFNRQSGGRVYFKCENFQRAGAFKFRGAANAIFSLSKEEGARGIVTHSSGNHAQAVALASAFRGFNAIIVMPENASEVKINAVREYGAEIIFCESTISAREESARRVINETGALFIHPYDHPNVIAGQGTAALELLKEVPSLDVILTPVGGGGLISGTAIAAKNIKPGITIIGCEPELADDTRRSFLSKKLEPVLRTDTIADGLRTSLGELPLAAILRYADDIITVSEHSIIQNMRDIWERMNIIAEPSSAVPVAVLTSGKIDLRGKKTGVIVTGGNVDLGDLPF